MSVMTTTQYSIVLHSSNTQEWNEWDATQEWDEWDDTLEWDEWDDTQEWDYAQEWDETRHQQKNAQITTDI